MSSHDFTNAINNLSYIKENISEEDLKNLKIKKLNGYFNIFEVIIGNNIFILKYSYKTMNYSENEFKIYKNMTNSSHIIKIHDCYESDKYYYYLEELLYTIPLNYNLIDLIKKILISVAEVHSNNYIHLDIHKNNFLMDKNKNIKIIDLELSKEKGKTIILENIFGNIYKYPPKFLEKGYVDIYVDIWSLAILFYELVYNRPAFMNFSDYKNKNIVYLEKDNKYNKLIFFILEKYEKLTCNDILEYIKENYEFERYLR